MKEMDWGSALNCKIPKQTSRAHLLCAIELSWLVFVSLVSLFMSHVGHAGCLLLGLPLPDAQNKMLYIEMEGRCGSYTQRHKVPLRPSGTLKAAPRQLTVTRYLGRQGIFEGTL